MVQTRAIFGISFFEDFGDLQVTLGSHLGLPKALLGVLSTSKTLKKHVVSLFLERHLFAALDC